MSEDMRKTSTFDRYMDLAHAYPGGIPWGALLVLFSDIRDEALASCATGPWLTEPPGEDVPSPEPVLYRLMPYAPRLVSASSVRTEWRSGDRWARINTPSVKEE